MRTAIVLLLAAPAFAAGPGYGDIFDPFSPMFPKGQDRTRRKQQAFDRAVSKSGPARAVKEMRVFEAAIAKLEKNLDKDWVAYGKIAEKWWGWRRQHERAHQKKHGQPPAEYPVPPGLNQAFLDQEKRFKESRSLLLRERLFQEWCVARVVELLTNEKELGKVASELRKKPPQALRAAQILVAAGADVDALCKQVKHPAVLAALLAGASWSAAQPFLAHPSWPVRAGAMRTAKGRAAIVPLYDQLAVEPGRLRDDAAAALRRITGHDLGTGGAAWKSWYEALPGDWAAPPPPPPPKEEDREKVPGVFSDSPVTAFGVPTSSRGIIYCIDATDPAKDEVARSVASLPEGALFGVVVYSAGAKAFKKGLVAANAPSRAALAKFLGKQKFGNAADPHAGLVAALDLAGGKGLTPPVADTLVFVTLTGPRDGRFEDPRQVMLETRPLNALKGLRIHTVGRSSGRDAYYLQKLARPFGGTFVPPG